MNKRITSLLLSIVMVFSMIVVAVPVYAADITPLYIKPDKTEASPGDTISYEVIMGPVANLAYMKIKLVIPEGLTYVSGSGTDAEGIEEKMNTSTAEYTDSTKVWLVQDANYTSTENTLLFMFKCTVDEKASGVKAITLTMDPDDNFDTSDDNITMDDSALGSEVTIKSSAPTTYTVSFNANGGTGTMADVTGVSGEYTLPENGFTAPAGKQFKAWSVDGTEKAVGDIITVTADTEVKAVWEDIPVVTYTVSFNANGGTGTMADVTGVSGEYTLPENGFTAPAGKQFKAWEVNGTEKAVGDTITVTADTEVKTVWEDIPVVTYTVSFDANGGTGTMAEVTGVSGEYALPENSFTAPAGQQFKAWEVNGTEKAVGDTITVTADTEVKAVWEDIPVVTYTVSFDANGGTGTMAEVTGVSGEYTLPENGFTAPAGKQFKAWEVNGTEKAVGDTITVTADTEVKAVWEDIPVTAVTYDIDVIDGVATNRNGAVITEAEEESIVYITADSAPRGKEFREWVILSRNVTLDNAKSARTSFEMPAADVEIIAVYQDKESDFDSDRWYWSIMQLFNQKFTVSASAGEGGSITNEGKTTVKYNNSITYIITPDDGYEIEAVYVNGKNVGAVDEYKFRGVKSNQTIEATFVKTGWDNPFIDIFETDSYYDAIEYVYENKLFKGVSAIEFAPDTTMTRAMFVTVLGRLADVDEDEYTETSFEDVIPGTWYASYVEWAADNGIVNGYGNGLFGVEDEITIEQAVVILARFADYIGIDLDTNAVLDRFFDADEIADWAVEAMMWAVDDEIYEGINGRLNPKAPAKRWMLAEILLAFDEAYGE